MFIRFHLRKHPRKGWRFSPPLAMDRVKHVQIDDMVETYQKITNTILSETFPLKTIIISEEVDLVKNERR